MALITIKDLPQGIELDRSAMQAVTGGARARGRQAHVDATALRQLRVVDYPPGFVRDARNEPATQRQMTAPGPGRRAGHLNCTSKLACARVPPAVRAKAPFS